MSRRTTCPSCRLVLPEDIRDPAACPRCRAEAEALAAEEERIRRALGLLDRLRRCVEMPGA